MCELIKMDSCKVLVEKLTEVSNICRQHYIAYNFHLVADTVMALLHASNNFFESARPWELKNGNEDAKRKLETIISLTMESLRVSGIILWPIIPDFCDRLLKRLNIPFDQRVWKDTKLSLRKVPHSLIDLESNILFKRIILESEKPAQKQSKPKKSEKVSVKDKA